MLKITKNDKFGWSANAKEIDYDVVHSGQVMATDRVRDKIKKIYELFNKDPKNNFGICLQGAQPKEINNFLSAIYRITSSRPKPRFYVSTDNQEVIDKLVESTSVDETLWSFCPIMPNYTGDEFTDREKFIIDFFCLKKVHNIYSNPNNKYAFAVASACRSGVYFPDDNEVFVHRKNDTAQQTRKVIDLSQYSPSQQP